MFQGIAMDKKQIIDIISTSLFTENGKEKLTCSDALKIAEQTGVEPKEIGEICNERSIRICQCQLGFFK